MTRAYIRVLPDLYRRKALGICECDTGDCHHVPYPPAALGAFLGVLCLAEAQAPRGRFAGRKVLEALLEGANEHGADYAAEVGFLISQGDLVVQDDRTLYVDGWDELQEGDWQVTERMRRYRTRKNPDKPAPVDVDTADDPAVAYMQITGHFPRGKAIDWIDDLTRQFGAEATRRAIADAAKAGAEGLLGRASDALRLAARQAERQEKAEEERKVSEGRRARASVTLIVAYHNNGKHEGAPDPGCPECHRRAVA